MPEETDGEAEHLGPRLTHRGTRSEVARARRAVQNETYAVLREARIAIEKAHLLLDKYTCGGIESKDTGQGDLTFMEAVEQNEAKQRERTETWNQSVEIITENYEVGEPLRKKGRVTETSCNIRKFEKIALRSFIAIWMDLQLMRCMLLRQSG